MVASFYYRWREIGWIEKEIEIGQPWPEANKTEVRINFIIQLSFWPDPRALNISSFSNRFKSTFSKSQLELVHTHTVDMGILLNICCVCLVYT